MEKIRILFLVVAGLFVANSPALNAKSFVLGKLEISNAWARETPGRARTAAVYIERISNFGSKSDSLINIGSPLAAKTLIHETLVENSIAKMIHIEELKIPVGNSVTLKPGGLHIMMFDIKKKLVKGFNFPMVLKFKESGRITVIVEVKEIGTVKNLQMNHKKIHKH